jgi:hypothetical protein
VHHNQAFRAKLVKGKPVYINRQVQASETPCKWEIKIYTQELDYPITLWKSFFDQDSARTIETFLVKEIFGRIDPNGQIKRQYSEQTFSKALILDRETDEIVFQYPEQGFMILDVEEARKELLRVNKYFKEKNAFPPQEYYSQPDISEQEFKATTKVFKEDKTDYSHIFLQMKEALYSECARLNLADYIVNVADLTFISFSKNYLAVSASAMEQKEKRETFLSVLNQFYKRFFGESVQVGYKKKETIQQTETQPKLSETKLVEVERSEVAKVQRRIKRHADPDKVFTATMIEFNRNSNVKLIEFQSLELKFRDDDNQITHITLPNEHLIEAFEQSDYRVFFDKAHEKNFGGTYKIVLRHEPIDVSFLNLKPKKIY